jgi:hypothetical protein
VPNVSNLDLIALKVVQDISLQGRIFYIFRAVIFGSHTLLYYNNRLDGGTGRRLCVFTPISRIGEQRAEEINAAAAV